MNCSLTKIVRLQLHDVPAKPASVASSARTLILWFSMIFSLRILPLTQGLNECETEKGKIFSRIRRQGGHCQAVEGWMLKYQVWVGTQP